MGVERSSEISIRSPHRATTCCCSEENAIQIHFPRVKTFLHYPDSNIETFSLRIWNFNILHSQFSWFTSWCLLICDVCSSVMSAHLCNTICSWCREHVFVKGLPPCSCLVKVLGTSLETSRLEETSLKGKVWISANSSNGKGSVLPTLDQQPEL